MFISNQFFWGVVEDRKNDPLYLGRVRVRIFGIHSHLKVAAQTEGAPTESLLWCHVLLPTTSAGISGIGDSPTGLVEGSHVMGIFRDTMCQDAVIIGSLPGIPVAPVNPNEGFNDPNGMYPRYINEPDTNTRARGGIIPPVPTPGQGIQPAPPARQPVTVEEQNLNRDVAPAPDKTPADEIKPNPNPNITLEQMLRYDEGIRISVYWDTEGYPTIGIGHLIVKEKTRDMSRINSLLSNQVGRVITDGRITEQEASALFDKDVNTAISSIKSNSKVGPVYAKLDDTRKMAIVNMTFQMGIGGVDDFTQSLAYMAAGEWDKAYNEMLNSLWARQTPQRANRVAKIIRDGNLNSYSAIAGKTRVLEMASYSLKSAGVLFEEPDSPYAAVYPYNHVYESESGHIQEFDDTSGAERYYRKHPAGTFEEIGPGGTRVCKIVGEDFLIVKSDRNVHISGNLNVVVDGDATILVQGNLDQTVEGQVTQLVRGNVAAQIDGNVEQTVNGNVTETVQGNTTNTTVGDYTQNVDGNYTLNVAGSKSDTVAGDWSRKAANVTDAASGTHKSTGNGASVTLNSSVTISGSTINMN